MTPREDLMYKIQMVTSGYRASDVIAVLCDCLAGTVAYIANDLADAEKLAECLLPDLKQTIRANWDEVRKVRIAASHNGVGHA